MFGRIELGKVGNTDLLTHDRSSMSTASCAAQEMSAACVDWLPPPNMTISSAPHVMLSPASTEVPAHLEGALPDRFDVAKIARLCVA
jgi:hypothetical protein